jgi:hypothetical protein
MKTKSIEDLEIIRHRLETELKEVQALLNRPKFTNGDLDNFIGRYFKDDNSFWFIKNKDKHEYLVVVIINIYANFVDKQTYFYNNLNIFPAEEPFIFYDSKRRGFKEISEEKYMEAESTLNKFTALKNSTAKKIELMLDKLLNEEDLIIKQFKKNK